MRSLQRLAARIALTCFRPVASQPEKDKPSIDKGNADGTRLQRFLTLWRVGGPKLATAKVKHFLGVRWGRLCREFWHPRPATVSLLRATPTGAAQDFTFLADWHEAVFDILLARKREYAGAKAVLLAHADPENLPDPYVLRLCRHFRSLGRSVILCTTAAVQIDFPGCDAVDAIVRTARPAHRFARWKTGFAAFPSLYEAAEVTLCDDSVFGPMGSYAPAYTAMDNIACDFWALTTTAAGDGPWRLHSCHLVLKAKALRHPATRNFLDAVPPADAEDAAVRLEALFGLWLETHGLQPGAFLPIASVFPIDPTVTFWDSILQWGCPVFRRDHLACNGVGERLPYWWLHVRQTGYPIELISGYFHRLGLDISRTCCPGERSGSWPPDVIARQRDVRLPECRGKAASLAVILHCFYPDILSDLAACLQNLPRHAALFASTDNENKARRIREILSPLGFVRLDVRVFPNRGWDIGPFLAGFSDAIAAHSTILKIHVKGSTHLTGSGAQQWREEIYGSLIGSEQRVGEILRLFEEDAALGMLAPVSNITLEIDRGQNGRKMDALLARMGLFLPEDHAIDFPAGSMFWARSEALRPLLDIGLTFDDFEPTSPSRRDGTLGHAVERLFFFSCCAAGYGWGRVAPEPHRFLTPSSLKTLERLLSGASLNGGRRQIPATARRTWPSVPANATGTPSEFAPADTPDWPA